MAKSDVTLTFREQTAVALAFLPLKQAAHKMGCSNSSLKNLWQKVFDKCGFRSRGEVYIWAVQQGIVQPTIAPDNER